jgi:transposase
MMDRERLAHLAKTLAEEALSHGDQLDALRARIAELEAERDAAKAGEARAVEGLRRIREELETIAAGKEEEVRNDFSSGESHGWGSAYLHVCRIIGNAATQPALDWLAQREREAAARELNQLGPLGSSNQELFMVPWSEIKQRIAALANQQPTACSRSEVRGEERFRA